MTTREEVKKKVINLLAVVSVMDILAIAKQLGIEEEKLDLRAHLLLSDAMISALAGHYTAIYNIFGGGEITVLDAATCKTVEDVINLVWNKIPKKAKQGE